MGISDAPKWKSFTRPPQSSSHH